MVPRQGGCWKGCNVAPLGSSNLPVPTCTTSAEGAAENLPGAHNSSTGLPEMAISHVVDLSVGLASGATLHPASLPFSLEEVDGGALGLLPGPSGSGSGIRSSVNSHPSNLDQDDLEFLSHHLANSTKKGYSCAFNQFVDFCTTMNVDPITCAPAYIVKFLRVKYEKGATYGTINLLRSAISKYHGGYNGNSAGEHPLVCQAVRAVFRLRPPLPRYKATFDIGPVLSYVASLEPLKDLDLKLLTLKAFFLVTTCSISRVSSVSRLLAKVEKSKVMTCYIICIYQL